MQQDQAYLAKFIKSISFVNGGVTDQNIVVKGLNAKHAYCSNAYAKLIGQDANNLDAITSTCTNFELKRLSEDHFEVNVISNEDLDIMQTRNTKAYCRIHEFTTGLMPRIFIKSPIINPDTDKVVGLLMQCFEAAATSIGNQIIHLFSSKNENIITEPPLKLTNREKQIIFFFLAGKSSQEIALMLSRMENKNIAKSTIDNIFNNQLFKKFAVYNRLALNQKLVEYGYDRYIPHSVLTGATFPLEQQYIY